MKGAEELLRANSPSTDDVATEAASRAWLHLRRFGVVLGDGSRLERLSRENKIEIKILREPSKRNKVYLRGAELFCRSGLNCCLYSSRISCTRRTVRSLLWASWDVLATDALAPGSAKMLPGLKTGLDLMAALFRAVPPAFGVVGAALLPLTLEVDEGVDSVLTTAGDVDLEEDSDEVDVALRLRLSEVGDVKM